MFRGFYVAFTDDPEYFFGAEHVAPGRERESFLVFPKTSFPTTHAQERVLDQIAAHLGISSETHYRALVSRTKHMLHLGDLRDAHRDAPLVFTRLASPKQLFTKEWFEKVKADRELKQSIGKAFQADAELEDAKTHCLRLARSRDESFEGDRLLRSQKGYTFTYQGRSVDIWPEVLPRSGLFEGGGGAEDCCFVAPSADDVQSDGHAIAGEAAGNAGGGLSRQVERTGHG